MERTEMAKKLFLQAQRMTVGMAAAVVAYGAMGYYLVSAGYSGSVVLDAGTYKTVKYVALAVSAMGIFAMWQLGTRMIGVFHEGSSEIERHPQKLLVKTIVMSAAAELPVLLGLVLVFFGKRPFDYIPFAVLSLAGFAFAFPKKQQWVSWLGADF